MPCSLLQGDEEKMKQLKVCILGQGRSGRNIHGRYLLTDKDRYKIVAVVDPLEERRQ